MGQPALEGKGQASPYARLACKSSSGLGRAFARCSWLAGPSISQGMLTVKAYWVPVVQIGSVESRQEHILFSLFIVEVEDSVSPSSPIERNGKGRFTPRERQKRVVESTGHRESDGSEFRSRFG